MDQKWKSICSILFHSLPSSSLVLVFSHFSHSNSLFPVWVTKSFSSINSAGTPSSTSRAWQRWFVERYVESVPEIPQPVSNPTGKMRPASNASSTVCESRMRRHGNFASFCSDLRNRKLFPEFSRYTECEKHLNMFAFFYVSTEILHTEMMCSCHLSY